MEFARPLNAQPVAYFAYVAAFPRCISEIHSRCADLKSRQALLANLIGEELAQIR